MMSNTRYFGLSAQTATVRLIRLFSQSPVLDPSSNASDNIIFPSTLRFGHSRLLNSLAMLHTRLHSSQQPNPPQSTQIMLDLLAALLDKHRPTSYLQNFISQELEKAAPPNLARGGVKEWNRCWDNLAGIIPDLMNAQSVSGAEVINVCTFETLLTPTFHRTRLSDLRSLPLASHSHELAGTGALNVHVYDAGPFVCVSNS